VRVPNTAVHADNVSIVKNGAQHRVAVNSDSGAVISNPGALPGW
jgi:predicted metal-dependent TIM-barrel fold hydrolase